ncbi:MAG: hypothetical protein AAFN13_12215, partial [Bacteroidota bacterium]
MRATLLLLTLIAFGLSAPTAAQGLVGGGLILGIPQGEFGDATDNVGFGASGIALYQFPLTPLAIGVEGTFLNYGSEEFRTRFSTTVNRVFVDVTTDNNIAQGHLVLRLLPPVPGPITPYAD